MRSERTTRLLVGIPAVGLIVTLGMLVGRADETPHAAPSSARVVGAPAAPIGSSVFVRGYPAMLAESETVARINEEMAAISARSDRLVAEAKAVRSLPQDADLRWDHASKAGGWNLYQVAPVGSQETKR